MGKPSTRRAKVSSGETTVIGRSNKQLTVKKKHQRKRPKPPVKHQASHIVSNQQSSRSKNRRDAGSTSIFESILVARAIKHRKKKMSKPVKKAMSKQARKRKLKRQAEKLKRLEERTNRKKDSGEESGLAKERKKRKSRRKVQKKQEENKNVVSESISLNICTNINSKKPKGRPLQGKTTLSSHLMLNAVGPGNIYAQNCKEEAGDKEGRHENKNRVRNSRKRKREEINVTVPKKTMHGESKSKEVLHDVVTSAEVNVELDKNWKALMKKMKYVSGAKKNKEEDKKTEDKPKKRNADVWFDDVDPELLEETEVDPDPSGGKRDNLLVKTRPLSGLTKYIGMDCEMVGIGSNGEQNMLARVSLVNQHGLCLYDKYVSPRERVTYYRTHVSGITKKHLENAEDFSMVQSEVFDILKGRILVGHALHNDLKVLFLNHPRSMIRDTAKYKLFKDRCGTDMPSLKKLSELILQVNVQTGEHDSVEDAQAAMKLFMLHRQHWEKELARKHVKSKIKIKKAKVVLDPPDQSK